MRYGEDARLCSFATFVINDIHPSTILRMQALLLGITTTSLPVFSLKSECTFSKVKCLIIQVGYVLNLKRTIIRCYELNRKKNKQT
jgi:hypothetical protein